MTAAHGQYSQQDKQQAASSALWGALVVLGIAVTVLGVLLITRPFETASTLAWLAGVALILSGIIETIQAIGPKRDKHVPQAHAPQVTTRGSEGASGALLGLVQVVAGTIIVAWPDVTLHAIAIVIGVCLVLAGLIRFGAAQQARKHGGRWSGSMALAGISIAVGVMALVWPSATIVVLAVLFGIQLIFQGIAEILIGLALRPSPR
jgi:uncharacterized membrane protein HdeD (DUF308 family)